MVGHGYPACAPGPAQPEFFLSGEYRPSLLPKSLLLCPGVGTSASKVSVAISDAELMGPLKALCAELWPSSPRAGLLFRVSVLKPTVTQHPRCENPGVWLPRWHWDDLFPKISVSELTWCPRHPQVPQESLLSSGLRKGSTQRPSEGSQDSKTLF